jgi:dihydrofolate synthase/folylpolyglutamate synthase
VADALAGIIDTPLAKPWLGRGFFDLEELHMGSLDYLLSFQRFGIKLGLDNITFLLEHLGNPHFLFPAIHITGTNGKGSVAAFFCSVLERMGFRVGRYISPHLVDFSERIVINGKPIPFSVVDELVEEIRPLANTMHIEAGLGHPTFFEAVTALAFSHFAREKVDFAVVEVGMGGRYDSTNVVRPCLSVITNVHLEHREYLGDTIEQIATEKAGIIKSGVPVVSSVEREEAKRIIDQKAGEKNVPVFYLNRDFHYRIRNDVFPRQLLDFFGPWGEMRDVEINLAGGFQGMNAAATLMGIEVLKKNGAISDDEKAVRKGMAATRWPARLEKISEAPLILLDGAHNPSAMQALADSVRQLFPGRRIILIIGMLSDKDASQCLRILRTISDSIVVTQPAYERALPASKLLEHATPIFQNPWVEPSLAGSLRKALGVSRPEDVILVCGSLFNVAEAKEFVAEKSKESARPA